VLRCALLHTVWTEKEERECCCMCHDTAAQTITDTAARTKQMTVTMNINQYEL